VNARRAVALAALIVAAVLAAFFVVAALHGPAQSAVHLGGRPVAVLRTLTPDEPQFGDSVVATIQVFVDTRRVDPRSVAVDARFTPFVVASSTRSVHRAGGISIVRVVDRLDCLDAPCLPKGAAATFRFPRLRIAYRGGTLAAAWPALRVHARLEAAGLDRDVLRVGTPTAHPSYRLPPGVTGWLLLAAATAGALGGLALIGRAVLPALAVSRGRRGGSPLERILGELTSANGDIGRRRRTLEQLARELEPLDESLSFESRVLAWSPQEPEAAAVSDLAHRVRTAVHE
jgi:hypothetical protein